MVNVTIGNLFRKISQLVRDGKIHVKLNVKCYFWTMLPIFDWKSFGLKS